jgi:hypothetical protein
MFILEEMLTGAGPPPKKKIKKKGTHGQNKKRKRVGART